MQISNAMIEKYNIENTSHTEMRICSDIHTSGQEEKH